MNRWKIVVAVGSKKAVILSFENLLEAVRGKGRVPISLGGAICCSRNSYLRSKSHMKNWLCS
jgi:hypothetical protein